MKTPQDILTFWIDEVGPEGWYKQDDTLDATIRDRFGATYDAGMEGRFGLWLTYPNGVLAYVILLDQFPRNMFRGDAASFRSDQIALAAAKQAIHRGWDLRVDEPARQFFYLPLMHAENLCDQDRCVRLMKERLPGGEDNLLHACAHREIIRRFGRFPYRNDVLGRASSPAEAAFMENGGYGALVRDLQDKAEAA